MRRFVLIAIASLLALCGPAGNAFADQSLDAPATQPAPAAPAAPAVGTPVTLDAPVEFAAIDRPSDDGKQIILTWRCMPYENPILAYEIWMSYWPNGPFHLQDIVPADPSKRLKSDFPGCFGWADDNRKHHAVAVEAYTRPDPLRTICTDLIREFFGWKRRPAAKVSHALIAGTPYYFKLLVRDRGQAVAESQVASATPTADWVAWNRLNVFIAMVLVSATILFFVWYARRNPGAIFIRRIAGLEAVDDAVGRAAEMGKPVYFCHGLGSVGDVVTISSINMLGKIAERTAEFATEMKVTCFDVLVMQVSQEMVSQACVRAGRPDAYDEEDVFFISDNQFAYATAVEGLLLRDMPATVFFFGQFQAESLLLSETGAVTKAIQIAGTDTWGQIPFFITTCDYTLIGEEMYAASAYLSREPRMLGSVKGQDIAKAAIIVMIIGGIIGASLGLFELAQWLTILN